MDKESPILYALAGMAIGAMAVYIYLTQFNKTQLVEITRDEAGRVIGIMERRV